MTSILSVEKKNKIDQINGLLVIIVALFVVEIVVSKGKKNITFFVSLY